MTLIYLILRAGGPFMFFSSDLFFSSYCYILNFFGNSLILTIWKKSFISACLTMTTNKPVSHKQDMSFDKKTILNFSWLFPFLLFASFVSFQCDQMMHCFFIFKHGHSVSVQYVRCSLLKRVLCSLYWDPCSDHKLCDSGLIHP